MVKEGEAETSVEEDKAVVAEVLNKTVEEEATMLKTMETITTDKTIVTTTMAIIVKIIPMATIQISKRVLKQNP